MLPARIDPKPALWEGLANATIIKKGREVDQGDSVDARKRSRRIFRRREILSRRRLLEDFESDPRRSPEIYEACA